MCPCMLVSNYWPLTLAMTVPAAPRMSTELRVWCLPMTALRTRSNSAKRSCTTSWSSSRFSGKRRGTSRLGHVSRKTLTRLTKALLIPKPNYNEQFAQNVIFISQSQYYHTPFLCDPIRGGASSTKESKIHWDSDWDLIIQTTYRDGLGSMWPHSLESCNVSWATYKVCLHKNYVLMK